MVEVRTFTLILFEVTFIQLFMSIKLHFSTAPKWKTSQRGKFPNWIRGKAPATWQFRMFYRLPGMVICLEQGVNDMHMLQLM